MATRKEWAERKCWRSMASDHPINCITTRCTAFWIGKTEETRVFDDRQIQRGEADGWKRLTGNEGEFGRFKRMVPEDERQCDCQALPQEFVCGWENQ